MKAIIKRAVVVGGRKTSVSLEDPFWNGFKVLARQQGRTLSDLISEIARQRQDTNLSSAIRLHVFENLRAARIAAVPGGEDGDRLRPANGAIGSRRLAQHNELRRPSFWEW